MTMQHLKLNDFHVTLAQDDFRLLAFNLVISRF